MRPIHLLLTVVVTACAAPLDEADGGQIVDGAQAVLELGTGSRTFAPLADGDEVPIIHGPQGGWHLWGSLRVQGLQPKRLAVTFDVSLEGPPALGLSSNSYTLDLVKSGSAWQWSGLLGLVPDPVPVDGRVVVLSMAVTDTNGVTLHDTRRVVARLPPGESP